MDLSAGACLHQLVERQVAVRPDSVAVVSGDERLSYGALDEAAASVARELRAHGAEPGTVIGVCLERSASLVVALLGVLKTGAAYLPLDPDSPPQRWAYMIEDCSVRTVVSELRLSTRLPADVAIIHVGASASRLKTPPETPHLFPPPTDSDAAYIIYTSGSTGGPKGVVIEHRNVVRLFESTTGLFGFGPADVWSAFHSYAFDFSVWEMWGALVHGGTLVVVPSVTARSPGKFARLLSSERVTVLNQTPSAFRGLAAELTSGRYDAGALRLLIFGGEALDVSSLRDWFEVFGDQHPAVYNMYGITEITVHATLRRIQQIDALGGVRSPIGTPLPNLRTYVLDEQLHAVGTGATGELYVGGASVGRGYVNRDDLTAERFLADPFLPGERLYRSGDAVRRLPDGGLEYVGRLDRQIKVRGYRIEPGEIEAELARDPAVSAAVVGARLSVADEVRIVAYYVARRGSAPSAEQLRANLARTLPPYMLPAAFVALEELPLTLNGKVDWSALPDPYDASRVPSNRTPSQPMTHIEAALAEVWRDVLKTESIQRGDNFFELGGDSLLAVRVIAAATDRGLRLHLADIFEQQTLAELAAVAVGRN